MGRVLLITGAGGGLGSLVARSEANSFDEMILLDRSVQRLRKAESDARAAGNAKAHLAAVDVTDAPALRDALSPFSRIDGLVNAAGVLGPVEKFGEGQWEEWARAISVNLVGNVAACHFALPALLKSRRGKIVNFSGGGAAGVRVFHTAYASSKAAIVRFTEILAAEYRQIDANAIAPRAHNTGIWVDETHDNPPAKWADKSRFSSLVSFLLSEKSDGISGKFIHINDKWEKFRPEISKLDMYTLRRVEPKR
jgi:NAD(P)-dependent dehydrogenase (short-subunit alcohol dehydrogenase family)